MKLLIPLQFQMETSSLEQTYWIIAILGSAIFLVIFALTFIGGGDVDMETDATAFSADDGGVGFQFFTFKNIIAFFTIFGWTGIVCIDNQFANNTTIIISSIAGLLMMITTSLLFFWMKNLAHSTTLKISNSIGKVGEVYLPIGANRSKIGKVQVKVQGSLRELEAVTDSQEDIATNSIIKVISVISGELLLVEKFSK